MATRRGGRSRDDWVTVTHASDLLGVSAATLRRWSDAGEIRSFTTPGGHRRICRSAVLELLPPTDRDRPTLAGLGETPDRMARIYRRELRRASTDSQWVAALADAEREPLRAHSRKVVEGLLRSFDAPTAEARDADLAAADQSAAAFGWAAAGHGVSLRETVEAFLRFRLPFFHELAAMARRRGLRTVETADLLEEATDAFDRLLSALMRAHDDASLGEARSLASEPDGAT